MNNTHIIEECENMVDMFTSEVSCNVIAIYTQHASVYNSVITNTLHFTVISSHQVLKTAYYITYI